MLRITTQKKRGKTVLNIEGRLAGPLVGTLEQCWRELRAASPNEKVHLASLMPQERCCSRRFTGRAENWWQKGA